MQAGHGRQSTLPRLNNDPSAGEPHAQLAAPSLGGPGPAHMHACTERVTTRDMEFDDMIFTNVCTVQLESHHILKERTAHQIQN